MFGVNKMLKDSNLKRTEREIKQSGGLFYSDVGKDEVYEDAGRQMCGAHM